MSNGYKAALARFEAAVRAHDNRGAQPPADWAGIDKEYEDAKRHLTQKLSYRHLAAEQRNDLAAVEFGYRQCEQGKNLQAALGAARNA